MSRMQDETTPSPVHVGIDVSKHQLDIFIRPLGTRFTTTNDAKGLRSLVRRCARHHVQLIVIEATGRYHRSAHRALHEAGLPVAVVNPYRSRKFADSLGQLAKTDEIDAEVLADLAATLQPEPSTPPSHEHEALRDLTVARRQVLNEKGSLQRQLYETRHPLAKRCIQARMRLCDQHLSEVEAEIRRLIHADDTLRRRFDILTSIPGLGPITATTLLTDLTELGRANAKEIAALAGVAPMNRDSGTRRGARTIRGGRPHVRNLLYMCAICVARRGGAMGSFYRRLIAQGKKPKVAITAVMRKLVILANSLIAENRHWRPAKP